MESSVEAKMLMKQLLSSDMSLDDASGTNDDAGL